MNSRSFILRSTLLSMLFCAALLSTLTPMPTTFNVTAVTERLEVKTVPGPTSRWVIGQASLRKACHGAFELFSGQVDLKPEASVRIERISQGPLLIGARAADPSLSVADLYDEGGQFLEELAGCLSLRFEKMQEDALAGRTVVLPVTGRVEVGREPQFQSSAFVPVLRSGKVAMLGPTLLGGTHYRAGSVDLDMGDRFVVTDPRGATQGLVVVNEEPGMTAVLRTVGSQGKVLRFAAKGYEIQVSLMARLRNDPTVTGLWAGCAFLLGLFAAARKWWSGHEDE